MERNIHIHYNWFRPTETGTGKEEALPEHVKALEESAVARIYEMQSEGFTSGELHDNIHMTDSDPEGGVEYQGWWRVTYL